MSGLYIHIPLCVKKCAYCDFYSVETNKYAGPFLNALREEFRALPEGFAPETVFIGGGTPTALSAEQLETLLDFVTETVDLSFVTEYSCEANPGTVDLPKLAALCAGGVNRLSLGVQSFDDGVLKTLGRIHSAEKAEAAFRQVRAAGFENISVDLMFGVPAQTLEMLAADLDRALALGPEHISIYNLMYEEGTPLTKRNPLRLDEEVEREMYDLTRKRLTGAGFEHYEISNFAKPGFECRHNLLYWSGGEYIGCGPSAHSHWQGTRWANVADLDDYCANGPRREFEEMLDEEAKARETLVMGLRLIKGVEVSSNHWKKWGQRFQPLEKQGLLVIDGHHVRLSDGALFVSDAVFAELV